MNARSSSAVKLTVVEVDRAWPAQPLLLTLLSLSITFLELLFWTRLEDEPTGRKTPDGGVVELLRSCSWGGVGLVLVAALPGVVEVEDGGELMLLLVLSLLFLLLLWLLLVLSSRE